MTVTNNIESQEECGDDFINVVPEQSYEDLRKEYAGFREAAIEERDRLNNMLTMYTDQFVSQNDDYEKLKQEHNDLRKEYTMIQDELSNLRAAFAAIMSIKKESPIEKPKSSRTHNFKDSDFNRDNQQWHENKIAYLEKLNSMSDDDLVKLRNYHGYSYKETVVEDIKYLMNYNDLTLRQLMKFIQASINKDALMSGKITILQQLQLACMREELYHIFDISSKDLPSLAIRHMANIIQTGCVPDYIIQRIAIAYKSLKVRKYEGVFLYSLIDGHYGNVVAEWVASILYEYTINNVIGK